MQATLSGDYSFERTLSEPHKNQTNKKCEKMHSTTLSGIYGAHFESSVSVCI